MIKAINIKNRNDAEQELIRLQKKKYPALDIRFENTHLLDLNTLIQKSIFVKNDLFANAEMLWEIMQPVGTKGSHNSHGLTPKEILEVLNSLIDPYYIYKSETPNRYVIVSLIIRESGDPLIIVIEVGSGIIDKIDANINKMITMYPKAKINNIVLNLSKSDILYKKYS